ncbi:MAG: peptidyl-prolyl cis-trans isomerase [Proteobacteria bacterium]|nr:peptidyl-prolyl cis-trans isomerase [Pseudomonadota bacterium]MBU1688041.1 peptidyl-prolyl cis-trans isomerase [Pseudomonadota bacterium]
MFKSFIVAACLIILPAYSFAAAPVEAPPTGEKIVLETNLGKITVELFDQESPLSAVNFRDYVSQGFYNNLIFHRVIPGFMVQGGGFESGMKQKTPTRKAVPNEATNGLKNTRGTLAMARTNDINSATCQFFINVVDNAFLDHRSKSPQAYGYAVFGKVVEGMEVVDAIAAVSTTTTGGFRDVPKKDVVILKAYEEKAKKSEKDLGEE